MESPKTTTGELPRECSVLSLEAREPMIGTASRVDVWFLLSYGGPMGAKALAESSIPAAVKDLLNQQLEAYPNSRLLLFKPDHPEEIVIYIVNGRQADPFYRRIRLERYEDLPGLDLQSLADESASLSAPLKQDPFYMVCTNGRRDACCARYGLGVFDTLRAQGAASVWQCSHVSGHRYAANVLMFPHGIYYGRMTPEKAGSLLSAGDSGQLLLENYRGRAAYPAAGQAGEALLREQTGERGIDAYRLLEHQELPDDIWRVRFASRLEGAVHELSIRRIETGDKLPASCRGEKQSAVVRYELENYQMEK